MDVSDAMRAFVVTVHPGCAVDDAEELLLETGFAMVPVVEGHRLVGVVGLDDIPIVPRPRTARHRTGRLRSVDEVMTTAVVSTTPGTDLDGAVRLMRVTRLTSLPVLDGDDLVGVVARRDVADRQSRPPSPTVPRLVGAAAR